MLANEEAIRHIFEQSEAAWNDHDPQAIAAALAPDCEYALAAGPLLQGREAVISSLGRLFQGILREARVRFRIDSTRPVGDSAFVVDGGWVLDNVGLAAPLRGIFSAVCEKRDGKWWPVYWRNSYAHDRSPTVFAEQIEAFREHDKTFDAGSDPLVLFAGDSHIRFWDLEKHFPEWNTLNRGFGGAQVSDVIFYADDVLRHRPAVLVYNCGGNNLDMGKSLDETLREFEQFWAVLFRRWPGVKVLLLPETVGPRASHNKDKVDAINDGLRRFANSDERVTLVEETLGVLYDAGGKPRRDLRQADQVHFNEQGYEELSRIIRRRLQETISR